jgi:PAS domain S-box-containing protein
VIKKFSALLVEDSEADAELIVRELKDGGFDPVCERVETREAMAAALDRRAWDVVISDYSMPRFGGDEALTMMKERGLDIPFISVSGTIGEDVAVSMMKAGAHDYVMKNNLARLVPTIERELQAAESRRQHRNAQASTSLLAAIVESSDDAIVSKTLDGIILSWNGGAERMFGYTAAEMIGQRVSVLVPPDRQRELSGIHERIRRGEHVIRYETVRVRKDGSHIVVSVSVSPVKEASGQVIGASSIARDITLHKEEENERLQLIRELTNALQHVKALSGLLPICSCCKKIRDDRGYWQSVEVYVRNHSDAEFSHSICPDCFASQYPGVPRRSE